MLHMNAKDSQSTARQAPQLKFSFTPATHPFRKLGGGGGKAASADHHRHRVWKNPSQSGGNGVFVHKQVAPNLLPKEDFSSKEMLKTPQLRYSGQVSISTKSKSLPSSPNHSLQTLQVATSTSHLPQRKHTWQLQNSGRSGRTFHQQNILERRSALGHMLHRHQHSHRQLTFKKRAGLPTHFPNNRNPTSSFEKKPSSVSSYPKHSQRRTGHKRWERENPPVQGINTSGHLKNVKLSAPSTPMSSRKRRHSAISLIGRDVLAKRQALLLHAKLAVLKAQIISRRKLLNAKGQCQQPCLFFNKFGKCQRGKDCPYIHDRAKVAMCKQFLKGNCAKPSCSLSHEIDPAKMPVCSYFLKGACTVENCNYRHVKVNKKAKICPDFQKGWCPRKEKCPHKHILAPRKSWCKGKLIPKTKGTADPHPSSKLQSKGTDVPNSASATKIHQRWT